MRPIASTWVASMQNIDAPDSASELMCVKCQSLASPFTAEYWHIGATMMRFRSFSSRSFIGENRALMWGMSGNGRKGRAAVTFKDALVGLPAAGVAFHVVPAKAGTGVRRDDDSICPRESLHQPKLQQERALEHREIIVGDHGQHRVALGRDVGVDALHVVDLVAHIGLEDRGAVDHRAGPKRKERDAADADADP